MDKWLILGLRQEIDKISLKHFVVPGESEKLSEPKRAEGDVMIRYNVAFWIGF